ncbi:hypothetical protein RTP6_006390 [Batrachochytrium dendrobatidis]
MLQTTIAEPKVVVLQIVNPALFSRIDLDAWVLQHMLVPRTIQEWESDNLAVMDISLDSKTLEWMNPNIGQTSTTASDRTGLSSTFPVWSVNRRLRLTPETSILTFAAKQRLVVLLDTSPSMSVVDTSGRPKVLLSAAFDTICKCFDGLVRPFSILQPWTGLRTFIEPKLIVTVIADAGNSGHSSISANEDLPLRVLLQEVEVTTKNLMCIAEKLYDSIIAFENVLLSRGQRKSKDPVKLATAGVMPNEVQMELTNDPIDCMSLSPGASEKSATQGGFHLNESYNNRFSTRNAFSTLDAGLLALELLPSDAMPAIIYVTDGVSPEWGSKDVIPRHIHRRIVRDFTRVNIIQVGSSDGFLPQVSLGYVPNTEFLRFIAQALFGVFMYDSDCPYMSDITNTDNKGDVIGKNSSISTSVFGKVFNQPPMRANIYHCMFTIREINLNRRSVHEDSPTSFSVTGSIRERPVDSTRSKIIHTNVETGDAITNEEFLFPWTLDSKPSAIAELLCGSRDYVVTNIRLSNLVAVRLREGFRIESIHPSRRSSRNTEKVEIAMSMPWLPNVTIMYTIKVSVPITDAARRPLSTHDVSDKPLRIEINVLAHHSLAIVFINVQCIEQLGPDKTSFHEKLLQLDAFIKGIVEADEATKIYSAFNTKQILAQTLLGGRAGEFLYAAARNPSSQFHSTPDLPSNYWQYLSQALLGHPSTLDEWKGALILRSTASKRNQGKFNSRSQTEDTDNNKARRQVATIYLSQLLTAWCSMSLGKATLVKLVYEGTDSDIPTGFCFLHLHWETDSLVILSIYTFSIGASMRGKLIAELVESLKKIEHKSRSSDVILRPVVVCKKPAHKLLVRYDQRQRLSIFSTMSSSALNLNECFPHHSSSSSPFLRPSERLDYDQSKRISSLSFESAFRLVSNTSRPYLRLRRWVWFADIQVSSPAQISVMRHIQERAFLVLYTSRLDDHFMPISESTGCVTFYREMEVTAGGAADRTCAVQFVLLWNAEKLLFVTELWVEPLVMVHDSSISGEEVYSEYYENFVKCIGNQDRNLLGRIFVFEYVQELRNGIVLERKLLDDTTVNGLQSAHDPNHSQIVPTQFYLPALLYNSSFVMCVYHVLSIDDGCDEDPTVNGICVPSNPTLEFNDLAAIPLDWCEPHGSIHDSYCIGSLLNSRNITALGGILDDGELLTDGCPIPISVITSDMTQTARSNTVLYGFLAKSLLQITDVALKWPFDASGGLNSRACIQPDLLEIMRTAIHKQFIHGSVFLIRKLEESVCYIKYLSPDRLIFAVLHIYDPLNPGSLAQVNQGSVSTATDMFFSGPISSSTEIHYFSISLFECVQTTKTTESLLLSQQIPTQKLLSYTKPAMPWCVAQLQCDDVGRFVRLPQGFILSSGGKHKVAEKHDYTRLDVPASDAESVLNTIPSELLHHRASTVDSADGEECQSGYTAQQAIGSATLSPEGHAFYTIVNESFSTAFSKTLFLSLMQGAKATEKDIIRAFRVFEKTTLVVDITPLLDIFAVLTNEDKVSRTPNSEDEVVDLAYRKILLRQFEPLVERSVSEFASQLLFFRPTGLQRSPTHQEVDVDSSQRSDDFQSTSSKTSRRPITQIDTSELFEEYRSLVLTADTPLFVNIECQFQRGSKIVFKQALHALPLHYPLDILNIMESTSMAESGSPVDYSPSEVSYLDGASYADTCSIEASKTHTDLWENSVSSAKLCINCWTLKTPNTPQQSVTLDQDTQCLETANTPLTGLESANLSDDMRNSVISLRNDIENLTRERILRSMLIHDGSHPSSSTLYSAASLIRTRHNGSGTELSRSSANIETILEADSVHLRINVAFVDPGVCLGLFRSNITLFNCSQMDLHQIGESYYLLDVQYSSSGGLPRKYWAFIVPKLHEVHLYFYCEFLSITERVEIVRHIESVVSECAIRANRLKLLHDLNETRIASDFLIAASESSVMDKKDTSNPQSSSTVSTAVPVDLFNKDKFSAGHFACPLVYWHKFPLHWRVSYSKAISAIVMSVANLAMHNHKDLFVFSTKTSVFYMRIQSNDTGILAGNTTAGSDSAGTLSSFSNRLKPISIFERVKSANSNSLLPVKNIISSTTFGDTIPSPSLTDHTTKPTLTDVSRLQGQEQFLYMFVYGVDQPDQEIVQEFVKMIKSKLHGLTQTIIGTFLARNYSTKLTPADVEFIMPIAKNVDPVCTKYYQLPVELENPHLFMLLLRQSLLTFLHPFNGSDVAGLLVQHYSNFFRQSVSDQYTRNAVNEFHIGDFSFLYNSVPSRINTTLEALVGDGIAAVCLTPISPDGHIMYPTHDVSTLQSSKHIDLDNFLASVPDTEELAMCWLGFKIVVQIWTQGSINVQALMDKIGKQFTTTSNDYAIESYFRSTDWAQLPPHESVSLQSSGIRSSSVSVANTSISTSACSAHPGVAPIKTDNTIPVPITAPVSNFSTSMIDMTTPAKIIITSPTTSSSIPCTAFSSVAVGNSNLSTSIYHNVDLLKPSPDSINIVHYNTPLVVLPKMLHTATLAGNPVVQAFKVLTKLPLNTVATGMLDVLQEEGLQLYLFSRNSSGGDLMYITSTLPHENFLDIFEQSYVQTPLFSSVEVNTHSQGGEPGEKPKNTEHTQEYIIVAAVNFACDNLSTPNTIPIPCSTGSTSSAFQDKDRDSLGSFSGLNHTHQSFNGDDVVSVSSSTSESLLSTNRASRLLNELDEVCMFGDSFLPYFPIYGKRCSFIVVTMATESVNVFSYNWKKIESERVFLRTLKLLNLCKIRYQFQTRKLKYMGLHIEQDRARITEFGEKRYSTAEASARVHENSALSRPERRFRLLDFIYHIGSFDADDLQRQIVDFLELFFRYGKYPLSHGSGQLGQGVSMEYSSNGSNSFVSLLRGTGSIQHQYAKNHGHLNLHGTVRIRSNGNLYQQESDSNGSGNALSLTEMSEVLRTIQLIHSASAPIFFSEYRSELMKKWDEIQCATRLDDPNILKIIDPKHISTRINIEGQSLETVGWYKTMINDLLMDYVSYLEVLGMERVSPDLATSIELSQHGGKFSVAPNFSIDAPSMFLTQFFSLGVIIVQCDFFMYFATINVLSFKYQTDSPQHSFETDESAFEKQCNKLKTQSHIVSFSYDFHLRYFQEKLFTHFKTLPFDLLSVLRSFVILNPRKPRYSRNRIVSKKIKLSEDDSSALLFKYILKNPQTYNFHPLMYNDVTTACWLTTSDASFNIPGMLPVVVPPDLVSFGDKQLYTIIICPAPASTLSQSNASAVSDDGLASTSSPISIDIKNSMSSASPSTKSALEPCTSSASDTILSTTHFEIEYFLLIVNNVSKFPLFEIDKSNIMEQAIVEDPMREYIADGYYLHDIAKNTEKRIEILVDKASKYFGRDSLWTQLLSAKSCSNTPTPDSGSMVDVRETQTPEWTRLFLEKTAINSRNLSTIDLNIKHLLEDPRLQWAGIVDHLSATYAKQVRMLPACSAHGPQHILIINPYDSDYMIRFAVGLSANHTTSIEIFSLSREGASNTAEYTHINDVFNTILFYLWSSSSST